MGTAEVESGAGGAPEGGGGRGRRLPARDQGPGHLRLRDADQTGEEPTEALAAASWSPGCRKEIGPIASPDAIQWAPGLPKTRSGKIMRRILRKIAANETDGLGDTSTLADPAVVDELVQNRTG